MIFEEYKYVGFKTRLNDAPIIKDVDEVFHTGQGERYQSIYRFNSEILEKKSLSSIKKGTTFYADYLVFDIDSSELTDAYASMQKLVEYLEFREVGYETWFSGSKGFHVQIPTSQFEFKPTDDHKILAKMSLEISTACGITTDSSIYNVTRIFRMPGSLNLKSGLYKIPVNPNTPLVQMLEDAKAPMENPYPDPDDYGVNDVLTKLYHGAMDEVRINRQITPTEEPKGSKLFVTVKEGGRNDACYKLARKLARRSVGEKDALKICAWWGMSLPEPMNEREVKKTVASAYTKGMNELVDEESFHTQFFDAERSLKSVRRMVSNLKNTIIKTGFDFIDNYTMGLYKGDVVFLIARPGNFKTCVASCILQKISQTTGKKTLFFSMEMSPDRLSMRFMQAGEKMTQLGVLDAIKKGHSFSEYRKKYKDVEVIGLSSLTIEMVLGMVDYYLEEKGEIGAIAFDYLSLFRNCANNTEATAKLATELKTRVAKAANCVVFCLVQGKRVYEGSGGNIEIDKQAGKDSSSIEDSGDYLIGMWNHEGKHYGRFLKSRAFNSGRYKEGPYMEFKLDKPKMLLKDVKQVKGEALPEFKQVPRGGGYD